jgi:hypothetical protein
VIGPMPDDGWSIYDGDGQRHPWGCLGLGLATIGAWVLLVALFAGVVAIVDALIS